MATEQPQVDSAPASPEDRLAAYFNPAPKAPVEETSQEAEPESAQADDAPEDTPADDAQAADDTQESEEPFIEVPADDGKSYKVPAALKGAFERQKDYTQKTQALSTLTKSAEDRVQFAEAKEKLLGAVLQDVVALRETQGQLDQLNGLDWAALYNADPGQALNLRNRMDALKTKLEKDQQAVNAKAQQIESARKQHSETQWKLAVEGVKQRIGSVSSADDIAMLQTVQKMGFSQEELKGRFADPRFLEAIYKAAKYDALQGQKPGAVSAVNKAPPVVKPGAVKQGTAAANQYRDARQRLKKSGSIEDAARLFMLRK